jgi:hypothetical protein
MGRLGAVLFLTGMALLLWPGGAKADGPATCSFFGTVQIGGAGAPGGTLVTAIVEGAVYHTFTPVGSSIYSITIQYLGGMDASFCIVLGRLLRMNVAQLFPSMGRVLQ